MNDICIVLRAIATSQGLFLKILPKEMTYGSSLTLTFQAAADQRRRMISFGMYNHAYQDALRNFFLVVLELELHGLQIPVNIYQPGGRQVEYKPFLREADIPIFKLGYTIVVNFRFPKELK